MTNDQPQLTVFVSSMIGPLWDERAAVEEAIRTGIPLARTWVLACPRIERGNRRVLPGPGA